MTSLSGTPAYQQVAADLRAKIRDGALPPGARLPTFAQLCEMYEVSRPVIQAALNELRHDDLVIGQQGKGVFVREDLPGVKLSPEARHISERLDALTEAVRHLDERVTQLEQSADPGTGSQAPPRRDAR